MNPKFEQAFRQGWKWCEKAIRRGLHAYKEDPELQDRTNAFIRSACEASLKKMQSSRYSGITADIFETHRSVIVRVLLPEGVKPRKVNYAVGGSRKDRLELIVPGKPAQTVMLPATVLPRRSKVRHEGGILEILLPKRRSVGRSLRQKR